MPPSDCNDAACLLKTCRSALTSPVSYARLDSVPKEGIASIIIGANGVEKQVQHRSMYQNTLEEK